MPKRAQRTLTDAFVRGAKPRQGRRTSYGDAVVPGFELRVNPDGGRTFAFRYKAKSGRTIRVTLGRFDSYLQSDRMSVAEARDRAAQLRAIVNNGGAPQGTATAHANTDDSTTLREVASSYMEAARSRVRPRTWVVNQSRLTVHVLPCFGDAPIVRRQMI